MNATIKNMFYVVCMYSFGTIIFLAKHLTTYWCVQVELMYGLNTSAVMFCHRTAAAIFCLSSLQECNIKIVLTHTTYIMRSWESILKKLSFMQDKNSLNVDGRPKCREKDVFSIVYGLTLAVKTFFFSAGELLSKNIKTIVHLGIQQPSLGQYPRDTSLPLRGKVY